MDVFDAAQMFRKGNQESRTGFWNVHPPGDDVDDDETSYNILELESWNDYIYLLLPYMNHMIDSTFLRLTI